MKKHFITTLTLLIACSVLCACGEEQAAQKASVDLKPANSHAANIKTAAAGQKPASPKPATSVKEPAAPANGAAKAPAGPASDAARTPVPAAPAAGATKAPATSPADAAKASNAPAPAAGAAKTPNAPVPAPAAGAAKTPNAPAPAATAAAGAAKNPEATAKTPEAPAKTAAKVEDPPPALSVPPGYRYEPRGRRDPFVNPVPKTQGGSGSEDPTPVVRPDGLPGVLVSEVKLSGIVHSADKEMNKAMLVVGKNTYFAKKGDRLFDGVIKEIRPNEVVFAMVSSSTRKPVNRDTVVRTGASSGTSAGEKK